MSRLLALIVLIGGCGSSGAVVGGDLGGDSDGAMPGDDGGTTDGGGGLPADWLVVQGNRIVHTDGTPFHGRGADLHDERSCEACSFAPRDPTGLDRWSDELIDNW